ncbi:NAD(P)H dehydrogenase assembly family protein [Prochlorococcus sp. MIT 1223]|uniref:NAD(P)H dehydrogenase assembly family protein n=1 Tax=Prochlorococcus sp. MIT 1223 TaxID=3096217 RepID=UPI002A766933|nr:NAD(P)H dehydrogenase assembly family protein [Prochlorococcus sp. MIT 1223]
MDLFIGAKVFIKSSLPYLKTTDPMPMLRPPDLVTVEELGEVIGLRAKEIAEVKFRRGTFLIPFEKLSMQAPVNHNE